MSVGVSVIMEISRFLGKFSAFGTSFLSSHCSRVGLLNRICGLQKMIVAGVTFLLPGQLLLYF